MNPPRHPRDSGFALLLVFALAAIVGMMLYLELPRVAFEAQRVREEVLIQRGEQYKRAIRVFYRRFQRYPPTIDALENTNKMRFLRRRYKDPMTGKDEWRQIHAGPGGIFTDSLTQKPPQSQQKKDDMITSVADMAAASSSSSDAQQAVPSMVPRRRPSDGVQLPGGGASGGGPPTDQDLGQQTPFPQMPPDQLPAQPTPDQPGQPGQPIQPGQPVPGLQPGQFGQPGQPGQPPFPGFQPGQPGQPGVPYPGSQPGQPGQSMSQAGGNSPLGPTAGPSPSPVPGMIGDALRNPPGQPFGGSATVIGGGIAGVASTLEATGIKIYNDRTKYNEWEFIYDPRKEIAAQLMGIQGGLQQTGLQPGAPGVTIPTAASPFGSATPNQK